jgi:hypothetical protein
VQRRGCIWKATTAQWLAVAGLLLGRSIFLYTSSLLARIVLIQTTAARTYSPFLLHAIPLFRSVSFLRAHHMALSTAPALSGILPRGRFIFFIYASPHSLQRGRGSIASAPSSYLLAGIQGRFAEDSRNSCAALRRACMRSIPYVPR